MRYSEHHKAQTHGQIVERAAAEFRLHGFEGIGIAKIMSLLNLTHGGFYAHFKDKEDLIDQSLEFAMNQSIAMISKALESGGVETLISYYLSEMHRDHIALGCPLPILTGEQARRSPASKAKFEKKYAEVIGIVAAYLPGSTYEEKQARATYLMSTMTGTIAISRAVEDPARSDEILAGSKKALYEWLSTSRSVG